MPKSMSFDEASEYWDTHSTADVPSKIVEMEYAPTENDRISSLPTAPEGAGPPLDSPSDFLVQSFRGQRVQRSEENGSNTTRNPINLPR